MLVLNTVGSSDMHNMSPSTNYVGTADHCSSACMVNFAGHIFCRSNFFLCYSNRALCYSNRALCYSNYFCCCNNYCSCVEGICYCSLDIVRSLDYRSYFLVVVDGQLAEDAQLAEDVSLGYEVVILAYIYNNWLGKAEPDFALVEQGDHVWVNYNSCNNSGFHSNRCMDSLYFQDCCRSCMQYCKCLIWAGCSHNYCSCLP